MEEKKPVSVGEWMIAQLLMCIPVVNFILLIVWGFSKAENPSKSNWAKATLIWMIIGTIIGILSWGVILAFIAQLGALY